MFFKGYKIIRKEECRHNIYQDNDAVETIEGRFEIDSWTECVHSNHHFKQEETKKDEFGVI